MDEPVNYRMAERSWPLMQKLIDWGVCFPTDAHGNYEILQVHPKGKFCVTMKEPELKTILAQRMVDGGAKVLNRTMAVELLITDGRIAGAIAVNVRTGEIDGHPGQKRDSVRRGHGPFRPAAERQPLRGL